MKAVVALVGRPNVGKSTLFNRLTKTRDALVADQPGLTRDRIYGIGKVGSRPFMVVDTGGLSGDEAGIDGRMAEQSYRAMEEADAIVFLVDGREGLNSADEAIASHLRRLGKQVFLVLNKTEGLDHAVAGIEFHRFGLGAPLAISAAHGEGVTHLMERVCATFPDEDESESGEEQGIKIAIIGRPNVGKSTMVNRMLGEDRVVTYDLPGTTRDSVFIPLQRDSQRYTLIDTAGVRRRAKVHDVLEKFSVIKTLQAIDAAHVVIVLVSAREDISEQDARIVGYAIDSGRALIIAVNKWDGLDRETKTRVKRQLDRSLSFADFARIHFTSALYGSGVGDLFAVVNKVYESAMRKVPTPQLTRILEEAVSQHQPPMVAGRRIKLRYAHQGGNNPPLIVVHGNKVDEVPEGYKRYLANVYRKTLRLVGTPVRLEFKGSTNPFAGKKNVLTRRQLDKRRRLKRHVKKRGK
ncbi:MAG: ribosome biogenesis GTPase Der [Gammaproteobacteria bacterium]|nr:ribosome biogenesis GTPase Der [Gammaproteobacteria bacterium]